MLNVWTYLLKIVRDGQRWCDILKGTAKWRNPWCWHILTFCIKKCLFIYSFIHSNSLITFTVFVVFPTKKTLKIIMQNATGPSTNFITQQTWTYLLICLLFHKLSPSPPQHQNYLESLAMWKQTLVAMPTGLPNAWQQFASSWGGSNLCWHWLTAVCVQTMLHKHKAWAHSTLSEALEELQWVPPTHGRPIY